MFEVDPDVAIQSETIKDMMEDDVSTENGIPLPNVSGKILAKVIEYCKYHVDALKAGGSSDKPAAPEGAVKEWDAEFVKVDQSTLFELILVSFLRCEAGNLPSGLGFTH